VNALDRATGRFRPYRVGGPRTLPSDLVKAVFEGLRDALDRHGRRRPGALDRATGAVESWRNDPLDPLSLSTDRVWSVFEDRSRVLWVGTYGGGLNKLDIGRKRFHLYRKSRETRTR